MTVQTATQCGVSSGQWRVMSGQRQGRMLTHSTLDTRHSSLTTGDVL
jgi:hypothetical protein